MVDPVALPSGITYDRSSIEKWLDEGNSTCPVTMTVVGANPDLIPNHALRRFIQDWCVANKSKGVERISTPTAPADPHTIKSMLSDIACGTNRLSCLKALRSLGKGSERSRKRIRDAGAVDVLIDLVGSGIEANADREAIDALQEALGALVQLNLSADSTNPGFNHALLNKKTALSTVLWLLNMGSIDARVNAAMLLEMLATDKSAARLISSSNDAISGLINLLKEDLYPVAVKASLNTLLKLYHQAQFDSKLKLIQHKGAVQTLIELLPGTQKNIGERILALLMALSSCAEGRVAISEHALALPVLIRSLLVLSDAANEHVIAILWAIYKNSTHEDDTLIQEATQLGATQKLIVLAQMECSPQTKHQTKVLLKAFARADCTSAFHTSQRI